MTAMDKLRALKPEIEDEIGELEEQRAELDRQLQELRTVLHTMEPSRTTPRRVNRKPRTRNPTSPHIRAAAAITGLDNWERVGGEEVSLALGYSEARKSYVALDQLVTLGALTELPRSGSRSPRYFKVKDPTILHAVAGNVTELQ